MDDSLNGTGSLNDSDNSTNQGDKATGAWQYVMTRNFREEVETYLAMRKKRIAEKKKRASDKADQEQKEKGMHERGPLAREDIMLKICDLGNGCWTHHHFT